MVSPIAQCLISTNPLPETIAEKYDLYMMLLSHKDVMFYNYFAIVYEQTMKC